MTAVMVIVEFEAADGSFAELERILLDHAHRTLNEEPGCLRFEVGRVLGPDGVPTSSGLIVNELYADEAALAAHRTNPRMEPLRAMLKTLARSQRATRALGLDRRPANEGKRPEELNAANDD